MAIGAAFGLNSTVSSGPAGHVPVSEQVAALQRQLADSDAAHTRQLTAGITVALVVMLAFALVMGRVAAGRVLRPLRRITSATRRISADNLHERLAVTGPADQVKALADTVDALLARLEESFTAQRRFVADASHELRTPLATARATLDVAVAKPGPVPPSTVQLAERVRASLDEADTLVGGAARAGPGTARRPDRGLAHRPRRRALTAPTDLTVSADLQDGVLTRGNPVLLARLAWPAT